MINKLKKHFTKNNKIIIGVGIIIGILVIVLVISIPSNNFKKSYEKLNGKLDETGREYPSVNIKYADLIESISINKALKILEKDTGVIYIGYPECIYCRSMISLLLEEAHDNKLDKIYYLDISKYQSIKKVENGKVITVKDGNKKYYELLKKLGNRIVINYMLDDGNGNLYNAKEKRIDAPLVLFVRKGKIVSYNIRTLDTHINPYQELDKYGILSLKEIYRYGIQDVIKKD